MAERPFMQFYGSDFVGDTLHLTTEQIGAYMLLLIAMWNAKGTLPNDAGKLARITRLTPFKWSKIAGDLMPFFESDDEEIWHKRMKKILENYSEKRAKNRASGSLGGQAKALKDKEAGLANARNSLQRKATIARATPESITRIEEKEPIGSQKKTARGSRLPADWSLPSEWGKWAVEEFGVRPGAVRAQADRFRDFWIAKSGAQATKLDWFATWRNWCRTAFGGKAPAPKSTRQPTAADLLNDMIEERNNEQADRASTPSQQHALPSPR